MSVGGIFSAGRHRYGSANAGRNSSPNTHIGGAGLRGEWTSQTTTVSGRAPDKQRPRHLAGWQVSNVPRSRGGVGAPSRPRPCALPWLLPSGTIHRWTIGSVERDEKKTARDGSRAARPKQAGARETDAAAGKGTDKRPPRVPGRRKTPEHGPRLHSLLFAQTRRGGGWGRAWPRRRCRCELGGRARGVGEARCRPARRRTLRLGAARRGVTGGRIQQRGVCAGLPSDVSRCGR